ncbi:acyl- dehydrogenase, putative [Babesia ovis]|uniref:Acyl- dehydrogenase, putative n=1 Tax=Babesia ovis TaxID=5869 RepID=A0A9W5TC35_BABOV|nr:acyl- dehydrogenase, putative [Babesia ovis]
MSAESRNSQKRKADMLSNYTLNDNGGTEGCIKLMLQSLDTLNLAPSPVPHKLLDNFRKHIGEVKDKCSYCANGAGVVVIPKVKFKIVEKRAKLVGHKVACEKCEEIANLDKLINVITKATLKRNEALQTVLEHFFTINQIEDRNATQLQNAVNIAKSLQIIYTEIPWTCIYK